MILLPVDDLEGFGLTLETLSDPVAMERITKALNEIAAGEEGVDVDTVSADLARR